MINLETFILLTIAIAVGVALGTGRLSLHRVFVSMAEIALLGLFFLVVIFILFPMSDTITSYLLPILSANLGKSNFIKQITSIISLLIVLLIAFYIVMIFYNLKKYGLRKGLEETLKCFEDSSPPPRPEPKLDLEKLTNEQKKLVGKAKRLHIFLTLILLIICFSGFGVLLKFETNVYGSKLLTALLLIFLSGTMYTIYYFIWLFINRKKLKALPKKDRGDH